MVSVAGAPELTCVALRKQESQGAGLVTVEILTADPLVVMETDWEAVPLLTILNGTLLVLAEITPVPPPPVVL